MLYFPDDWSSGVFSLLFHMSIPGLLTIRETTPFGTADNCSKYLFDAGYGAPDSSPWASEWKRSFS
jgi:hypothetical protein